MSDIELHDGDKIRVTGEGTVIRRSSNSAAAGHPRYVVRAADGKTRYITLSPDVQVEVIEAAFADGGIYIDADNRIIKYTATGFEGGPGWFEFSKGTKEFYNEADEVDYPRRPVTRLDK